MKDLPSRLIASLAASFVVSTLVSGLACEPARSAAALAPIDATAETVEPDDEALIPCGPRRVLQTVCQQCHQNPPVNGAPFPLVTRSNIVRVTPDGEIRELMIQQIEVGRMPLSPVTIDYDSRETLLDWLHAGAPAEERQSCDELATPDAGAEPSDASEPNAAPSDKDAETDDDTSLDASASD